MALQDAHNTGLPIDDAVLEALDRLTEVVRENQARNREVLRRVRYLQRMRAQGHAYSYIVTREERPLIVELATSNLSALSDAGARFRRAEALALHDEGLTMDRIAELFGVTRQRVSALLREARTADEQADAAAG